MNMLKKRYNILYTSPSGNMMGGGQWSLYYLVKYLDKDIFHPIVLLPEDGELANKMRAVGADVIFLGLGRIRHLNLFTVLKLISIIKKYSVDIVHTDSVTEAFYLGIASKILGVPLVWHIRVSDHNWFLDRLISTFTMKIIPVAKALSSRFEWLKNTEKLIPVYNGVDIEEFDGFKILKSVREEFNIDKNAVLLACIGRVEERKGQYYLVNAIKDIDNVKLLIIGKEDEEYSKKVKDIVAELKISNRVIFTGHRKDVASILKQIDILVFPVVSGEGFSRVVLEAMAASKPVIASSDAGNPEAVIDGTTGYIVPTKDSVLLAQRINELVLNKEKRDRMGVLARQRVVDNFHIKINVKRIQEIYLEIL